MTAKPKRKATSMRLPARTIQQINDLELTTGYTQTQLVMLAVDRLYRAEFKGQEPPPQPPD